MTVDDAALRATVAACEALIAARFPADEERGAAAMLLGDGTIVTGTAPDAVNPSVDVCHEIEPYCAAHRLNQPILASVCLHRRPDGGMLVLSPCGVCRERLAIHGPDVLAAVPGSSPSAGGNVPPIAWKPLSALLPDYWMRAFPDELNAPWP